MKKYIIIAVVAFAVTCQLYSQSETPINPSKFHRKISEVIQQAIMENNNDSRDFKLKFDTLFVLLSNQPSPDELITTVIVEYDEMDRIKTAKIINEGDEDDYNYYYFYNGNQTGFSKMDFYFVENGQETYDGYQVHVYDQKNTLVASKEYDVDGELSYADSLHITYNGSGQITSHSYINFQEGEWHFRRGSYDIEYTAGLITGYYSVLGVQTEQGDDTLLLYKYENVIFNKNDPSFLFRDIFELYTIDSAGVDDFFFSRENALEYYQNNPIQYNKYRIDGVSHPDTLIETSEYTETDHVETVIRDQDGDEIYSIHYYFDNSDRLTGLVYFAGGDTNYHHSITYNEHDRIETIISESEDQNTVENNIYTTDISGNLKEYRQDVDLNGENAYSTILRFGYKAGASAHNISTLFLNVFPNPADQIIGIEILDNTEKFYDLEIIGITGKIIISEKVENSNNRINFDITGLISGPYFLIINSDGHRFLSRFVKL